MVLGTNQASANENVTNHCGFYDWDAKANCCKLANTKLYFRYWAQIMVATDVRLLHCRIFAVGQRFMKAVSRASSLKRIEFSARDSPLFCRWYY